MAELMSSQDIDIEYLYQHCITARLPVPSEEDEDIFLELVGKQVSDGKTDLVARVKAFENYQKDKYDRSRRDKKQNKSP